MSDYQKNVLIDIAATQLGVKQHDGMRGVELLQEFLVSSDVMLLCVTTTGKQLEFIQEVSTFENRTVLFYKTKRLNITDDNILDSVNVISLHGSLSAALYHALSSVFSPLLKKNDKVINPNVEKQLYSLQAGLKTTLLSSNDPFGDNEDDSLAVILSVDQELDYWRNLALNSKSKNEKMTAESFQSILAPLAKEFGVLDALQLTEVDDCLENARNVLDDLWKHEPPYPTARTELLMDIISNDLCMYLTKELKSLDIWQEDCVTISETLAQSINIGERWLLNCKELTEIFWPNYALHIWKKAPYVNENLASLLHRLQDVLKIRTIHKQIIKLLSTTERAELKTSEMFKPFVGFNYLQYGSFTDYGWDSAYKKFEHLLEPAEEKVAYKLKNQLGLINTNTRQLLHEFGRYAELIGRPVLKQILLNERQYLLSTLNDYVKTLSTQTEHAPTESSKHGTQIVSEILQMRQLEGKAIEIQSISNKLLDDLQGYKDLEQFINELLKELKTLHADLYDSWTSEILAHINDKSLSLCESDPVVQFTSNKLMRVNYSPRLVTLISEVRQLAALGYKIPENILQTAAHAKQFMKLAKYLEQIANFHNTIGDRMIPSQRPMMLNSALELARLIQEQEVVSWGNIKSVEIYVNNLKIVVDKLAKENALLSSYHHQIVQRINALNGVCLIKHFDKWKMATRYMREVMDLIEQKGFKNMTSWKQDLDGMLCGVLEKQYILSLSMLHLYMPQIYTELVYRDAKLHFSPNESMLKEKYNQQLQKFLTIPKSFRGVSDDTTVFEGIISRSREKLNDVHDNTEKLFEQLRAVQKHWESWLTLDALDTTKLTKADHWVIHFKASKTFAQEIAKLPSNEEKVGCFLIGLSRLRSDLESHNRSYWDQLVNSLKTSITDDVVLVQEYVDRSTSLLNKKPATIEQMSENDALHQDIIQHKSDVENVFMNMVVKSNVLASWTRERVDAVYRLQTAWERLQNLLGNYEIILAKQVEGIRATLNVTRDNLVKEIERFAAKWDQLKSRPNSGQIATESLDDLNRRYLDILQKKEHWNSIVTKETKLIEDYKKFNINHHSIDISCEMTKELAMEEEMWSMFNKFYTEFQSMQNEEWLIFRKKIPKLEDFLTTWQTNIENLPSNALNTRILQEIDKQHSMIACLKLLKGEDFTDKHWMEIMELIHIKPKSYEELVLGDFISHANYILECEHELKAICKKAASEIIIRQALAELDQWEVQARFQLITHKDSHDKELLLVKDFKDILNRIGDNQSLLQSVKHSSDYESFSERFTIWENRLYDLDQYLTMLAQIQRKWVYLEPIFGSGTLGKEKNRFDKLDREFRKILKVIESDPKVCSFSKVSNLQLVLTSIGDQLTRCQKSLDEFLAEKRDRFPRFLFLGDDDLLEVVGQSTKEQVIQTHLKKLFAGIHSIRLDNSNNAIVEIRSLQGESVKLNSSVHLSYKVEDWLNNLVQEMQKTLKVLLVACLKEGKSPDPLKYPSQILCLAASINFTQKCEQAISSVSLPNLLQFYKSQLKYYSSLDMVNEAQVNDVDGNVLELKLKALLLDTIHNISVIDSLINANVAKISDWDWQKQLRFYADPEGEVSICMVNAKLTYAYEYIGNPQKLVRTPLTDQCFLTLTQAMHLGMGGNPYGPAGTGKTESVKALGGLLGRQVLVFNCDEGIDADSMGRILSGLVKCGAWGCFDEFNRLDEATLSAISMHIQPIQNALKMQKPYVNLLGKEIEVNKHCGIFVTLNPAGSGYGGRNKLPDNLKQLFRPIIMTLPDHEQIARTLLHCDGYKFADAIGRKLIEVFTMAEQLLSKQQHYDWGLRALRTTLSGCGRAMRMNRKNATHTLEEKEEFSLVVKAIRTDTLSKLTFSDGEIFDQLLRDVFPNIDFERTIEERLQKALEESFIDLNIQKSQRQINKCIELYEQLQQRMGVAIVGPPSSGKSTIRNILLNALSKIGKVIKQHVFNPKSMPRTQLLGHIDADTRQWTDGVLTYFSLLVSNEPLDVWSLIVCDGDVDPEWVESLNSVLDDNRLLSLPSGWRVQFGPNVNFIFETHDLSYASPATISRMGIIFLSEEDVAMEDYVENYLKQQPYDVVGELGQFINNYLYKALEWVKNDAELVIQSSRISLVRTTLSQLRGCYNRLQFIIGLLNGLGGQMDQDYKTIFAEKVFEWVNEVPPLTPSKARFNDERNLIDTYGTTVNQEVSYHNEEIPLIFTAQINQTIDVIRNWLMPGAEQHFLIIGPHGAAKMLMLDHVIRERADFDIAIIHCSAHVTPKYIIYKILQYCISVNSSKGKIYKPKKGHLALFFKNLHLLKGDNWGTNMLLEFLQQLIVYKGFFDVNLEWVMVQNVTIVGTMAPVNHLSTRFTSLMHIYNVDLPQSEDSNIIFVTYLTVILKQCLTSNTVWTKSKISKLMYTMLGIYHEIKDKFNQVSYQHYTFSPHDITNWCRGILRYKQTSSDSETVLLEIIFHEALRIFYDRLVTKDDKDALYSILNRCIAKEWSKHNILISITDNYFVASSQFSSNKHSSPLTKLNQDDWSTIVSKGIIQYEREGHNLDVEIIPELLMLTANLSRALTTARGNCLLAGNSGVGRRSALRIISALESAKLIIPHSPKMMQFKNDLKLALQNSGVDGEQVYFLLEDHILSKDYILNILNIFLSSSEVPGLYSASELNTLVAGLKEEAARVNFDGNLYDFFIDRVKNKMHIVVCMEIQNDLFWQHIENCPALLQNCSVIWLGEWSEASIDKIPNLLIQKYNTAMRNSEMQIESTNAFSFIQYGVTEKYLSPIRFIHLIKTYIDIYLEKKGSIINKQKKLQAGVAKLTEARNLVADLKMEAAEQELIIAEKQGHANSALDLISATMKNANVQRDEMEQLKRKSEKENKELSRRKEAIEKELAEVEPLVQEARKAVGNIKAEALSEIRSLRAPPDIIRDILEGVLRLMGIQDTSWNSMKTFLAKRGVKEDIRAFNASKIVIDNRNAVERLIRNKPESFDPKSAKRASVAAAPLAAWVLANVRYSKVIENIKPLEMEQIHLEDNIKLVESQLSGLSAGLSSVDDKVKKLKVQLATYTREAAEIEIKLNHAQDTLKSAEGLVGKLIEEFDRWQTQLVKLQSDLTVLPINCLLAAGFISYLSSEPEDIRKEILSKWIIKISNKFDFSLEQFLTTEREQLQWQSEGLSTDQLSVQNAIIILKGKLTPFLIDPTSMAINWIKARFKDKNFEVTTQNSPKFNTSLELAIRFGKVLLIEEVESVSSYLLEILKQQFIHQGERLLINISGKLIDYHKDFQLLLTSRNTNIQLTADVVAHLNIVNFTTTRAGLTEQLLISAIRQENPQLEEKRKQLLRQQEELQDKQHKLQNLLLEDLVNSTGDILQNKNLLTSLNETKASSSAISRALKESTEIQNKLRQEYDVYKDISMFASSLYFAAAEFVKSNVLYSLSVSSFTTLFLKSLPSLEALQNTECYTHKLLIQALYQFMGRGIFKNDRLKFLLHIVYKMFPDNISSDEWNFLIGNIIVASRGEASLDKLTPKWLPEQCTGLVNLLQLALPKLYESLNLQDVMLWKSFMEHSQCEMNFPSHCKLSEFQKVIVVQVLRNDRLYSCICQCVLNLTGIKNLNLDVLHLSQIQKESNCMQPILLLTTSGNDPSVEIRELALNIVNPDKYDEISMGEGQESIAITTLNEAAQSGHWLILKNLHLVTSWLPVLCQHLQTIKPQKSFRLWLVTEAHDNFSSVLAENSLKIAYEVPIGIKNNLYRIFTSYGFEFIQNMNPTASRIFFVLACVHAVVQERRNFIPQGWSKWYEFSDTDLSTMVKLAEDIWNSQTSYVQWKYLIGWSAQAVYGGRIENRQDLIILEAYLQQYFNDEVLSHRWKPLNCNQQLPTTSNYQEYLRIISTIFSKDIPSYFGLPENVERAWEKNISSDILSYLKKIAIAKQVNTLMTKEMYQKGLLPYFSLWKKLNQKYEFIHMNPPVVDKDDTCIAQFIKMEFKFALNLIQAIHQRLSKLNKGVKSHTIGKEKELTIANSLLSYKTPDCWLKIWNGPKEPSKYLRSVLSKTINIFVLQQDPIYQNNDLDLSLFFNPQTFLSSCKQQFSRLHKIPLDELILQSYWKSVNGSIILTNLLIEGALFDGYNLVACSANSESANMAPKCYITWEEKKSVMNDDNIIEVPLYYTSKREKILTKLQVPCNFKEKYKWVEAGVAFFLS